MNLARKIRGWQLAVRLRLHGHKVGRGLTSDSWNPFFSSISSKRKITIGDNCHFGRNLWIWVKRGAEFTLGDNCIFGGDAYIRVSCALRMGDHSGIAEHGSMRDANHGIEAGSDFMGQPSFHAPITVGRDVWIGAGCRILAGATLPDGCIIGANSVVLKGSVLVPGGVYGGVPVRLLKMRPQPAAANGNAKAPK